jgi:hypothetical protein
MLSWADRNGVVLRLIEPGKPNQNAYVGSFSDSTTATVLPQGNGSLGCQPSPTGCRSQEIKYPTRGNPGLEDSSLYARHKRFDDPLRPSKLCARKHTHDPQRLAAYYLRVLRISTPRWPALLAIDSGLPLPKGVPANEQQRAWSSPIWFSPPP